MHTYSYYELQEDNLKESPEFEVTPEGNLIFHDLDLNEIIKQYGTPLRVTYLPKISSQIQRAKSMFNVSMARHNYQGTYTYCYCTKSSHFSFVLEQALKNDIHLETSSAYDLPIIRTLNEKGLFAKDRLIVCNGFKRPEYTRQITRLINEGFTNLVPVLDNIEELKSYKTIKNEFNVGIRIATEETPNFDFYTSRLGISSHKIPEFYRSKIKPHPKASLKMLHFFINTGIKDHAYYWNELSKCLTLYAQLKRECPSLDTLNIGGGLPFKSSLTFDYDYDDFIDKIILEIKTLCSEEGIPEPNLVTEFGSFTVAEAGAHFYSVLNSKQQNDRELWYMVNNSFMTTLPDVWGLDQRFIMLPLNQWHKPYQRVFLGGLTCDSQDFYNAEVHNNRIFLPVIDKKEPLHVGFFNTGAYQDALSGFGGIKHCLIPSPKHILIDRDENGNVVTKLFSKEQSSKSMLKTLGY